MSVVAISTHPGSLLRRAPLLRSVWRRVAVWLGQWLCGCRGHDLLTLFERRRICLQCRACGYRTPGWEL